jgi:hypothetical protein
MQYENLKEYDRHSDDTSHDVEEVLRDKLKNNSLSIQDYFQGMSRPDFAQGALKMKTGWRT